VVHFIGSFNWSYFGLQKKSFGKSLKAFVITKKKSKQLNDKYAKGQQI
jgi:hypothetical protein